MNFTTPFQNLDFLVSSQTTQGSPSSYNSIMNLFEAKPQISFFMPFDCQNQDYTTAHSLTPTRVATDASHSIPENTSDAPFDEQNEISSLASPINENNNAVSSAEVSGVKSTSPVCQAEEDANSQEEEEFLNIQDEEEREMLLSKGWKAADDQTLLGLAAKYKCDWKKISKKFDNKKFTPYFLKIRYKELIDAPVQKKHKFTEAEDLQLAQLYKTIGSDWNELAKHFKNRTGVMLKNRYYSYIRKRGLLDELVAKAESQVPETVKTVQVVSPKTIEAPKKVETYLEKKPEVQVLDFSEICFSQTCFEFEGLQNDDELHTTITEMKFDDAFFAEPLSNRTYGMSYGQTYGYGCGGYYAPQYMSGYENGYRY